MWAANSAHDASLIAAESPSVSLQPAIASNGKASAHITHIQCLRRVLHPIMSSPYFLRDNLGRQSALLQTVFLLKEF